MSLKKDKSVSQLVEKYTHRYPALERKVLRHMIRIDYPNLFNEEKNSSYQSNLKKLDRYLRRAYLKKSNDFSEGLSEESKKKIDSIFEAIKAGKLKWVE